MAHAHTLVRLFALRAADMTLTTDQAFAKQFNGTLWLPTHIVGNRVSGGFGVSCLGGLYTGAAKAGLAIVAATQTWAALTGALTSVLATIALASIQNSASLNLSLTTGNTGALGADLFVYGIILD